MYYYIYGEEMIDLIKIQKALIAPHIREGGTVADFTMGNGNDTLWLSNAVGENGHVYAFDVQQEALESTKRLLKASYAANNYTLILDSHSNSDKYINGEICAGLFNLGWLPGSDHSVRTSVETTLPAVKIAVNMLSKGGGLLIAVYPGHDEGRFEGEALGEYLATLNKRKISVTKVQIINSPASPYFYLIEKA